MQRILHLPILLTFLVAGSALAVDWTFHDIPSSVQARTEAADLDGDGDQDILLGHWQENNLVWLENTDGIGTAWTEHLILAGDMGTTELSAADIDNDGDMDFLAALPGYGDAILFENADGTGMTWTQHSFAMDGYFNTAIFMDADGDGDLDVITADNNLIWHENPGNLLDPWTQHPIDSDVSRPGYLERGDFDADGSDDLAVGTYSSGSSLRVFFNDNGDGSAWTELVINDTFGNTSSISTVEVNSDGAPDLILADSDADAFYLYTNDGNGQSWTEQSFTIGNHSARDATSLDVDDDGDNDLFLWYSAHAVTLENADGSGTSWTELSNINYISSEHFVKQADLNGDNRTDILLNQIWLEYPSPTPATIEEIQTGVHGEGDWVSIYGVVTQGHSTIHDGYVDVYVQDSSGYGIMLYSDDPADGAGLERGDYVRVTGYIDQYFDTTELIDFTYEQINAGVAPPAAATFATGDFNTEAVDMEGSWAMLSGTASDVGSPGTTFNMTVDDGSGAATVRVYDLLNFYSNVQDGDEVTVFGTIDTYQGEAQLQPSWPFDLHVAIDNPLVDFQVTPASPFQQVDPTGGTFSFDVSVENLTDNGYNNVQYWSKVILPNGNEVGPITEQTFYLAPFLEISQTVNATAPAVAPTGYSVYIIRVGYPNQHVKQFLTVCKSEFPVFGGSPQTVQDHWFDTGLRPAQR